MEITAISSQSVATGQNVLYTDLVVPGNPSIMHGEGSGLVKLRGLTNQCRARFRVTFNANITIPTGGTAGEISVAIADTGEPIGSTLMMVTPATVGDFFNVSATTFIDVPRGCCNTISVENTSTQTITVQNANLIVERVA